MGRSKIDPHGAVRDMFDSGHSPKLKPQDVKTQGRKPAAKSPSAKTGPLVSFMTVDEVAQRYSVSNATVWRWVKNDPSFPEPIKLSAGTSRWAEEQLRAFERHAFERSASKADSRADASGGKRRKGAVK